MIRTDDFESSAVARFPFLFRNESSKIEAADGTNPKSIFVAGNYSPGSSLESIFAFNDSTDAVVLEFRVGDENNAKFLEISLAAGETKDILSTASFANNKLNLAPTSNLFCNIVSASLDPVSGETVGFSIFGFDY